MHTSTVAILAVDEAERQRLTEVFAETSHRLAAVESVKQAVAASRGHGCRLVIVADSPPDRTGTALLHRFRELQYRIPVLVVTPNPTVAGAVECIKLGALDYVCATIPAARLRALATKAMAEAHDAGPHAAPLAVLPPEGRWQLAGYEVTETLGEGNIGVVFLARKADEQHDYALKILKPLGLFADAGRAEELIERFLHEAEAASSVDHPNIVRILEYGIDPDELTPYIVMEYFPASPLTFFMSPEARLSWRRVATIMRQIAAALEAIHAAGICHRDIKPGNILLGDDDVVKVTDFGIARLPGSCLTVRRQIIGSPLYLSPEACAALPVDHRADLFSLGVVGYELLTGQHPFRGQTVPELLEAIPRSRPPAPRKACRDVPRALQQILARLLRKAPEQRYQSATEVITAIDACLDGAPSEARPWQRVSDWWRRDWS